MGLSQQEAKKEVEDALEDADKNCSMPGESLMNDESDKELRDWLTALGVLVKKWLGVASLSGLIGRLDPMINMIK